MDISTFLLLISLISLHTFPVYGEDFVLMPIELAPVPCNDKAVEKLSRLAVNYINEDRTEGYKFALNRIANVYLHAQVSKKKTSIASGKICSYKQKVVCQMFLIPNRRIDFAFQ